MSQRMPDPEERFAEVVAALLRAPGVTPPERGRSFGSNGLKVDGKIFAMVTNDRLVVKLPRTRVDALVAAAQGERFDPRKNGRAMKEWLALEPSSNEDWLALAQEALAFVGSKGAPGH